MIHHKTGFMIDIILNKNNDYHRSEFARRKEFRLTPQLEAYIASPENIFLKKLEFFKEGQSEKHLNDIQEILASESVDFDDLKEWSLKSNLEGVWTRVSSKT